MQYSQRLGGITNEQFQTALDRFDLGKLIRAEPVLVGNFGQNVFLTTAKGEYVFRGKPHYEWQFKSEQFMAQLLHDKTKAPVPYPYLVDEKTDIFGWNYAIMPRLKGQRRSNTKEIAQAFGENLAEMQTLTWEFSGQYDPHIKTIKQFDTPHDEWIIEKIRSLMTYCTPSDIEWIESLISESRIALQIPFTPTFVMRDYQESNMVVNKVDGIWKVTGVFDLMENYFGDGEVDIPRMYIAYAEKDKTLAKTFLHAYISKHPVRDGFEKRYSIYALLDRIIVWEWAKRTGNCQWNPELTFKTWCEQKIYL